MTDPREHEERLELISLRRRVQDLEALTEVQGATLRPIYRWPEWVAGAERRGVYIYQIKLRAPTEARPEWFVIVSADVDGKAMVAFHSAPSFRDALVGMINRFGNGSLKWKEDQYG